MTVLDLIGSRSEVYAISDAATVHDAARYLRDPLTQVIIMEAELPPTLVTRLRAAPRIAAGQLRGGLR